MKPEEYKCSYDSGDLIQVYPGGKSPVIVRTLANCGKFSEIYLSTEDLPRLIAQLQEAQGELASKADELPDEDTIDDATGIEYPCPVDDISLFVDDVGEGGATFRFDRKDGSPRVLVNSEKIAKMISQLQEIATGGKFTLGLAGESDPEESTIDVRIAVVTARGLGNNRDIVEWQAYGSLGVGDEAMAMNAQKLRDYLPNPSVIAVSYVTARVPLPPKPVVHGGATVEDTERAEQLVIDRRDAIGNLDSNPGGFTFK